MRRKTEQISQSDELLSPAVEHEIINQMIQPVQNKTRTNAEEKNRIGRYRFAQSVVHWFETLDQAVHYRRDQQNQDPVQEVPEIT
jgi:hypothetical protein